MTLVIPRASVRILSALFLLLGSASGLGLLASLTVVDAIGVSRWLGLALIWCLVGPLLIAASTLRQSYTLSFLGADATLVVVTSGFGLSRRYSSHRSCPLAEVKCRKLTLRAVLTFGSVTALTTWNPRHARDIEIALLDARQRLHDEHSDRPLE